MKQLLLFSLFAVTTGFLNAQNLNVGIGTTSPNSSAQLDISSTTKDLLIPRMTAAQRIAIATPANGLMVFETTTGSLWVYNGSAWVQGAGGSISSPWTTAANNIYNSNSPNVGIGTTNSQTSPGWKCITG